MVQQLIPFAILVPLLMISKLNDQVFRQPAYYVYAGVGLLSVCCLPSLDSLLREFNTAKQAFVQRGYLYYKCQISSTAMV